MYKKIAIIGVGALGQAVAETLVKQKVVEVKNLLLANPHLEKLSRFAELGVKLEANNQKAVKDVEIIILCVKPQIVREVLKEIKNETREEQLIISFAAGIPLSMIESELSYSQPIVRVMPNLCVQMGESMSVWVRNIYITGQLARIIRTILQAIGDELEVKDEDDIDKATAISGSGPAYVFHLLEVLEESARNLGFSAHVARRLAQQTLMGSTELILNSEYSAKELREQVTSKGGTTEAAFKIFEQKGLSKIYIEGIHAAYRWSKELRGR